ncbi:uncharacterized protein [Acropora muricata]|uniref:uncharacterized protein n=1 Tax=Acropora muricata TaxID=159855 RepID=UPI0034E447E9
MSSLKRKRFWNLGKKSSVYRVSGDTTENSDSVFNSSEDRNRSHDAKKRWSFKSKTNFYSLEASNVDDKPMSANSSFDETQQEITESLDSMLDEDTWSLLSADETTVKLLSSQKRGSLALDEILQQSEAENDDSGVHVDDDVRDIVAAIARQLNRDSESESDSSISGSTTGVSGAASEAASEAEDVSSDEESEEESDEEDFDVDAHVTRLIRGSDSESESDSESDGDQTNSDASVKDFQKVVRKVMNRIKRERSEDILSSEDEESETSEKGSEAENSPISEDDCSSEISEEGDDATDASSTKSAEEPTDNERTIDPDIAELLAEGLVIYPKQGQKNGKESRTVYKYVMGDDGRIQSTKETLENEDTAPKDDSATGEADKTPPINQNHVESLASTLDKDKVKDLRWPFSTFYVKEFNYDNIGIQALPSYRSTEAVAAHAGRKRNVMLGRVWWVEWWAMQDTEQKKQPDKSQCEKQVFNDNS